MMQDEGEGIEDDKEIYHEMYENIQDVELTRLTEMVRNHYLNYLEKQLHENLLNSSYNKENLPQNENYEEVCTRSIKKTAELLEDKAVKACMIAKFYQRAMVKIIAIVRRTTEEKRLITHLEKFIQTPEVKKPTKLSKETQTEVKLIEKKIGTNDKHVHNESLKTDVTVKNNDKDNDKKFMTLDEKIEMFKKHLQKEKQIDVKKYSSSNNKRKKFKKDIKHKDRKHRKHHDERPSNVQQENFFSPTVSVVTAPSTAISNAAMNQVKDTALVEVKDPIQVVNENSNDSVALELARLFSEEKTELDEIFGINPNDEPDDPQICKILKEIEDAKVGDIKTSTIATTKSVNENPPTESFLEPKKVQRIDLSNSTDLSKSVWPCELFMQRRKLSESLARLIEEDLRWHDIIKWKFYELFGEDSDDEFTPCSPSIELNEVLLGSCIRRISPWVVKYLMKPMTDGLIGNRFLFKKLAKNLANNIIMENQYPDESIIKECVENYFCLHQVVMSVEDLDSSVSNLL